MCKGYVNQDAKNSVFNKMILLLRQFKNIKNQSIYATYK